jgi:hypothetical protein
VKFKDRQVYTRAMDTFLESFNVFRAKNIMPERGGFFDQSATWIDAATWLERRMEWNEQDAEKRRPKKGKDSQDGESE